MIHAMLAQAPRVIGNRLRRVHAWTWAAALLTLAGAALRAFRLGSHSLWYDEGFSVYLASMSLREATAWTARDVAPPLYYYLLHFWQAAFGTSEAAVRSLSALAGTLTIPFMYLVGKALFGRLSGFLAAALVAASPLYIWYSQETRTYALLTCLGLVAAWFLLKVLTERSRRRGLYWVGLLFAAAGVSLSHMTGALLLVFLAVAFLLGWAAWVRRAAVLAEALAVAAAFALLHVPWILLAAKNLGLYRGYWQGTLGIGGVVRRAFLSYWTGETLLSQTAEALLPAFVAVTALTAVALLVAALRRTGPLGESPLPRWFALLFPTLYTALPVGLFIALFLNRPKFETRHLLFASPGFFMILGAGLAFMLDARRIRTTWARWAARGVGAVALVFALGVFAYGNYNNYFDPRFQRDDFRNVARYIKERIGPNETVILCAGHFFPVFQYYFGPDNWHPLPPDPILDVENVLTYRVADDLNRILAGKDGVWVVFWQDHIADPNGILTMMLNEEGSRLPSGPQFWGVRYVHWALNQGAHFSSEPQVQYPQRVNFGNRVELLGFSVGIAGHLLLYWQALQPLDRDYSVSLRLRDGAGEFWGSLDRRPAGYYFPTSRWRPGEPVFGSNPPPALPGTPPGEYFLEVVVYDEATGEQLDVLDAAGAPQGQSARIGPVPVRALQPADVADLPNGRNPVILGGNLGLVAWQMDRQQASPGETVSIVAFWEAAGTVAADYDAAVALAGSDGAVVAEKVFSLGTSAYPTSAWGPGRPVRWVARVPVPAAVAPGTYVLKVALRERASGAAVGDSVPIGAVEVSGPARVFTPPQAQMIVSARFDIYAELYGADVEPTTVAAGEPIRVTLYWLAREEVPKSYTVFVHLIDAENRIWAQQDSIPQGGNRPTTGWLPGEYIADQYTLYVKPDTPPGEYWIEVGLYDAGDPAFPRLLVLGADGQATGDRVLLAKIAIR
ncbi:MAG: glycosyltransferase family 39 protein [Chloroflexi bacterium]|nr:glycosyltransferase family 39 protein [Chloroflexota bacterium]